MKKMSQKLLLSCMALAVGSAFAEEKDDRIEKVVVTAQKRTQTTTDVPQSMSVVSGAELEKEQVSGFSDYLKLVPGLQLVQGTQGAGRLVLRGINTGGVASTVAVYSDETPFGSSSGLVNGAVLAGDFDTFDLARIEVLRGPQGALYGASSLGGLLKFVTNLPNKDKFQMRMRAGASHVDGGGTGFKTNLMVNTPISDTLAFRASGSFDKTPGFIDSIGTGGSDVRNDINGSKNSGGRASLLYTPTANVSLRLSAVAQNINAEASNAVESDPNTLETLYGRPTQSQFVPPFRNVTYRVYNGTLNWDLGASTFTSSTSVSRQNQTFRDDATFNLSGLIQKFFGATNELYLGQKTNVKKLTQEMRLASNQGSSFDWLVGAFYNHEDGLVHQTYVAVTPHTLSPITTLPNLALVNLTSTYREVAAFGNVTMHMSDRTDLDVGIRSSRNQQDAQQVSSGALAGAPQNNLANSSESVSTFAIAPKYKLSENTVLYARAAKGYRPGGPNVLPPNAPAGTPKTYNSDTVMSYETGFKSSTNDGRFSFEASLYNIKWKDIQLLAAINGFGVNTNGSSASSKGVEFTFAARPIRELLLSFNGAFTNAKLEGSTSPLVGGSSGDALPFSPKNSLGLNGNYQWQLADGSTAYLGASLRHVGVQSSAFDAAYRAANGRQRELPSYNVLDAHAGWTMGKWSLDVYAKNLNNAVGKTSTVAQKANGSFVSPNGAVATGVIAPRTIGLTITKEY